MTAHVAGVPVEEMLISVLPVLSVGLLWLRVRLTSRRPPGRDSATGS